MPDLPERVGDDGTVYVRTCPLNADGLVSVSNQVLVRDGDAAPAATPVEGEASEGAAADTTAAGAAS